MPASFTTAFLRPCQTKLSIEEVRSSRRPYEAIVHVHDHEILLFYRPIKKVGGHEVGEPDRRVTLSFEADGATWHGLGNASGAIILPIGLINHHS